VSAVSGGYLDPSEGEFAHLADDEPLAAAVALQQVRAEAAPRALTADGLDDRSFDDASLPTQV
jgi:hypothetical protein